MKRFSGLAVSNAVQNIEFLTHNNNDMMAGTLAAVSVH